MSNYFRRTIPYPAVADQPPGPLTVSNIRSVATAAVVWRALTLVALGAVVGGLVNRVHPKGVTATAYEPPTMCSRSGSWAETERLEVLSPKAAANLCGSPDALVADVRDATAFAKGHIAGAVHIPCSGSVADVDRVRQALSGKQHLVVYGDSEDQGLRIARDLLRRIDRPGLSVAVIAGGWSAWFDAGLACSSGPCDDCGDKGEL